MCLVSCWALYQKNAKLPLGSILGIEWVPRPLGSCLVFCLHQTIQLGLSPLSLSKSLDQWGLFWIQKGPGFRKLHWFCCSRKRNKTFPKTQAVLRCPLMALIPKKQSFVLYAQFLCQGIYEETASFIHRFLWKRPKQQRENWFYFFSYCPLKKKKSESGLSNKSSFENKLYTMATAKFNTIVPITHLIRGTHCRLFKNQDIYLKHDRI